MLTLINTYKIPTFAICAIVNDDFSGLDDDDEKIIKEFINHFENGFIADWDKNIESPYFSPYNDIYGYCGSDVIDVDFYLPN